MNTLHITAEHITNGCYTGPDVSNYDGHSGCGDVAGGGL